VAGGVLITTVYFYPGAVGVGAFFLSVLVVVDVIVIEIIPIQGHLPILWSSAEAYGFRDQGGYRSSGDFIGCFPYQVWKA